MAAEDGSVEQGEQGEQETTTPGTCPETGKSTSDDGAEEPLNVRFLHSLEETLSHSVQAVKEAVIGMDVDDLKKREGGEEPREVDDENVGGSSSSSNRSLLQSVEESLAQSVQSVEETFVQSVQTVKEAANAAAEAAAAPAGGVVRKSSGEEEPGDMSEVADEAAILVHFVVQD